MCSTVPRTGTIEKLYTQKDLVLLETYTTEFHYKLYITSIQKLAINFLYVRILCIQCCGKECRGVFNIREALQDVLCQHDYAERVVSIFARQI